MRLQDIKDGKVKVNAGTSITYNGSVYRGQKQIMELVERVLPTEPAAEPEPEAKPTRRRRRSTKKQEVAENAADETPDDES